MFRPLSDPLQCDNADLIEHTKEILDYIDKNIKIKTNGK